ncbi:MAG: hypothetical protein KTR14_02570 [Vampirovibrio sp.]|nr:hypothetical protein [Vampirovibrio sp.]
MHSVTLDHDTAAKRNDNMTRYTFDKQAVLAVLNRILEAELTGVVKYTHFSFMIFGLNRLPLVTWFREQANESLLHAHEVGEMITNIGESPSFALDSLKVGAESQDTMEILRASLAHEEHALSLYRELVDLVKDKSIMLEEFARKMIATEEMHCGEVDKMIRQPGL